MTTMNFKKNIDHSRLMAAVHVIVWLSKSDCLMTSSSISSLVKVHSVVVRRIMQALAKAGIVESKVGRDGGYFIRKPANEITLGDVYSAINTCLIEQKAELDSGKPDDDLFIELKLILSEVEQEAINIMRKYTLAQVMNHTECLLV